MLQLNYIGTINLPNSDGVFPIGDGTFGQTTAKANQLALNRIYQGVQFYWGILNGFGMQPPLTSYSNLGLPNIYLGCGKVGCSAAAYQDGSEAATTALPGEIGAGLIGIFGYGSAITLRADYVSTGQSGGAPTTRNYPNGNLFSSVTGYSTCPQWTAYEQNAGEGALLDCVNVSVNFLGWKNAKQCYVAIDWKQTAFPTQAGHSIIFQPEYEPGSQSSQQQFGCFAILDVTNNTYSVLGNIIAFDPRVQDSGPIDEETGLAEVGDMVQDLTQSFLPPTIGGKTPTICFVVDVDGNFAARDDMGLVNIVSGQLTQAMQSALNHYASGVITNEVNTNSVYHDVFPGGMYPVSAGLYGTFANPSNDYLTYYLQLENGAPAGSVAGYAIVGGAPQQIQWNRYKRPGEVMGYWGGAWLGLIYYRNLPMFIFSDTYNGNTVYDVYVPKKLQYAVAFNGMRNFTRPISPTRGDTLS